jgi:hypothetical protein
MALPVVTHQIRNVQHSGVTTMKKKMKKMKKTIMKTMMKITTTRNSIRILKLPAASRQPYPFIVTRTH